MATLFLSAGVLIIAVGVGPHRASEVEQVDLVEVNHYYDDCGHHVLDQLIFYEWCDATGRFLVRDWRLLKSPRQWPVRTWPEGTFRAQWYEGHLLREVRADHFRETWTQHDPEVVNREFLPRSARRSFGATRR